ncbi:fasciclin domain-containing protein [Salibacteraceae bacterium]|jgi:transforming growth factor-beta-induced protein|nr:fasciclin domain-containing protein [Salibacteraceae bacterium]
MKSKYLRFSALALALFTAGSLSAQTNVFDDVIATSPNHTSLEAALIQEGLDAALRNGGSSLTVFAPDDDAFDNLATALNTDIPGLLALPNLDAILLYHVLGSTVPASFVTNFATVTPLNMDNTLKLTKTSTGSVYANQAMVTTADLAADNGVVHSVNSVLLPYETVADIAIDNGFSTLVTAVATAELLPALTDPLSDITVFAPTNGAFDDLAADLGTDINGILALSNLADILTYHVLGTNVAASAITNGDVVTPLSATNTLKLTKTTMRAVYVNQAMVTTADITADNGVVHVLDAALLPSETVVDVALDNGFSTLATAVITAELLPALTDPFATLTVFAPTNEAFDDLAAALNTDIAGILALSNLADILTYHVLGSSVEASAITNGDVVTPLSSTNTLKLTKTSAGSVYVNQAMVSTADVMADNGVVHILDAAVLPNETVIDVALDNGFSTLATAVIAAELLPTLSDPFAEFTVFAPTNIAFDDLASDLGTDLAGILALSNLADILTYHVVAGTVLSTDLTAGNVATVNGASVTVDLSSGIMINTATVSTPDVTADNGVVHVIDAVLVPNAVGVNEVENIDVQLFPNPAIDLISISNASNSNYSIMDVKGSVVLEGSLNINSINVSSLPKGAYFIQIEGANQSKFMKF